MQYWSLQLLVERRTHENEAEWPKAQGLALFKEAAEEAAAARKEKTHAPNPLHVYKTYP